jgi:NAD(P)-dependent dehydrogenase (short-subunit alcohol dehydrogenase family)
MDLELSGKKVLITGGSKGIGLAIARSFAKEGCELVLLARTGARLTEVATSIENRFGTRVTTIAADLSVPDIFQRIAEDSGGMDILVNNAGAIPPGNLLGLEMADWKRAWDVKVFGYIGLTQACYPELARRRGVVVNIIGAAGSHPQPAYIAGSSGNAALMSFTAGFAQEARKDGVRVVGVNPGPVSTERFRMLMQAQAEREFGESDRWPDLMASLPFGRAARPEEIADTVVFLSSARSTYTSGAIVEIDGAMA